MSVSHGPSLLLTTDAVGGVWRYTMELAGGLSAHGAEITLAVLGPAPSPVQLGEACAIPGLDLQVTGLPLDWTAKNAAELAAACETLAASCEAELAHLHAPALAGAS